MLLPLSFIFLIVGLSEMDRVVRFSSSLAQKLVAEISRIDSTLPPHSIALGPLTEETQESVDMSRVPFKEVAPINHAIERARDGLAALFDEWLQRQHSPSYSVAADARTFFQTVDRKCLESFATVFLHLIVERICPGATDSGKTPALSQVPKCTLKLLFL